MVSALGYFGHESLQAWFVLAGSFRPEFRVIDIGTGARPPNYFVVGAKIASGSWPRWLCTPPPPPYRRASYASMRVGCFQQSSQWLSGSIDRGAAG